MRKLGRQTIGQSIRCCGAVVTAVVLALSLAADVEAQTNPWQTPMPSATPAQAPAANAGNQGVDAGPSFRAFALQRVDAASAERQLEQFFASMPGVEIVADPPRNRLLVRGNPQVLQFAEQFLARLDQPATVEPAAAPAPSNGQLEAYPLTPSVRQVIADLQSQAAGRADLRVAIDERTSQALVLAPSAIHTQIRGQLAQPLPATAWQQPSDSPNQAYAERFAAHAAPNANAEATSVGPLKLRHLRADDLRVRLERLLSRPLPASTDNTGAWQSFSLEATPGAGVTVTVSPTTGEVHLSGPSARTAAWRTVIEALDSGPPAEGSVTQLMATTPANHDRVRRLLQVVQAQNAAQPAGTSALAALFQPREDGAASESTAQPAAPQTPATNQPVPPAGQTALDAARLAEIAGELLGPVEINFVEGLDVIVLRGSERDVQRVMEIINQIEQLSAVTVPTIEVYELRNVDSRALGALLTRLYQQVLAQRIGEVSITPLVKPNSLLLVGRAENVRMAIELIQRLDQPVAPTTRFAIFPLKHASAVDAKTLIDEFLARDEDEDAPEAQQVPTLAPRAMVVADFRTNSLIVSAGPGDMSEIEALVKRIDTPSGDAVDQVRVFPLRNAVASEMAETLRAAIQADGAAAAAPGEAGGRASALEFRRIGVDPMQALTAGVLTGARISADVRANALVVTAPAESMDLIAALIAQLDQAPNVAAELKVFTLENGDALGLTETLRALFGAATDGQQAVGGVGAGGLVRMQFSVDQRTNSIIAAGTREDLAVVEAILLRLDGGDIRERVNVVYRLNNAFAQNVSDTINAWLQTQRTAEAQADLAISPFEQIEREVIVVPELATNSLVVSATPRYYETVKSIIDQLDERPPMVMIQVLIAEVRLNDTDEFGVELGLQDSLLFDRSLLSDVQTISTTTETQTPGGAVTTVTQDTVINSNLNPGFNFNSGQPLGNNGSTSALATASNVAAQGLSNFSLGRVNSDLQFGGFVFSASSSGVNVLLRALQEKRRLEVLSRPQLMALDGQTGYVQVGQRVPRITATSLTQFGQTNSIFYEPVGIIMQVTPRISPDGLVVMQIQTEKSEVGPEAEGIPISVSATGEVIRAPRIDATTAVTTISALSGQTVVLSGLLTNRRQDVHRRVPILGDIPLIGDLFRYDLVAEQRTELLIILTPQIVHNKLDSDLLKRVESSRMSWILSDVINLHGEAGLRSRCDEWYDGETDAVYPTYIPQEGELLPSPPNGVPSWEGPALEPPPMEMPAVPTPPGTGKTTPRTPTTTLPMTQSTEPSSDVTRARYDEEGPLSAPARPANDTSPPFRLPQTAAAQ